VAALAIAELSATEAFAARAICLLCRGLFLCGPAVFERYDDSWLQRHCSAGAHAACTAASGFAGVTALEIAELSTTEAFAARTIRLPCRVLFLRGATVLMRDRDAWVQQRCSAGRVLCAQLPADSQVWRRWQLPN
jgi:hypothetical protein